MADEILRSKHGFGSLSGVANALQTGAIDAYDIVFLDGDSKPKVGWIDKNGIFRLVDNECVVAVDSLPTSGVEGKVYIYNDEGYFWNGTKFVNFCKPTDLTDFEERFAELQEAISKLDATVVELKADVETVKSDVGSVKADVETVKTNVDEIQTKVTDLEAGLEKKVSAEEVDEKVETALETVEYVYEKVKYEFTDTPAGTLVDYRDDEIRIMCPSDAVFTKQAVGVGGDPDSYYGTLKTYAPNDEAVGYIEHLGDQVDSEILTDLRTDEYGRKYQPSWLALAKYDESTDTWNYYGASSSEEKYIGWDYRIDWYNADGVMIASDSVRINLSNENCHFENKPYYVSNLEANAIATAKAYTDEQIEALMSMFTVVEF